MQGGLMGVPCATGFGTVSPRSEHVALGTSPALEMKRPGIFCQAG